ncbi:MAG: hypothetical protein WBK32_02330 [Candidatus Saccharicenans sp.]
MPGLWGVLELGGMYGLGGVLEPTAGASGSGIKRQRERQRFSIRIVGIIFPQIL